MKIRQAYYFITLFIFLISCSSTFNSKEKLFHGFKPEMMRKKKTVFLPIVLKYREENKYRKKYYSASNEIRVDLKKIEENYNKGLILAKKHFLKKFNILFPHQTEALLNIKNLYKFFKKQQYKNPIIYPLPFVKIAEKIGCRYLIIIIFERPRHVRFKEILATNVSKQNKYPKQHEFEKRNMYWNVNLWHQKGEIFIIDAKKEDYVYHFTGESSVGYKTENSGGYREPYKYPKKFKYYFTRPKHINAVIHFFKLVFECWN